MVIRLVCRLVFKGTSKDYAPESTATDEIEFHRSGIKLDILSIVVYHTDINMQYKERNMSVFKYEKIGQYGNEVKDYIIANGGVLKAKDGKDYRIRIIQKVILQEKILKIELITRNILN